MTSVKCWTYSSPKATEASNQDKVFYLELEIERGLNSAQMGWGQLPVCHFLSPLQLWSRLKKIVDEWINKTFLKCLISMSLNGVKLNRFFICYLILVAHDPKSGNWHLAGQCRVVGRDTSPDWGWVGTSCASFEPNRRPDFLFISSDVVARSPGPP